MLVFPFLWSTLSSLCRIIEICNLKLKIYRVVLWMSCELDKTMIIDVFVVVKESKVLIAWASFHFNFVSLFIWRVCLPLQPSFPFFSCFPVLWKLFEKKTKYVNILLKQFMQSLMDYGWVDGCDVEHFFISRELIEKIGNMFLVKKLVNLYKRHHARSLIDWWW